MKTHLTSNEHLEFKRIDKLLTLRKNTSSLILLGVNSNALAREVKKYFLNKEEIKEYNPHSKNILLDLIKEPSKDILFINLYEHKNIKQISQNLQFSRDFIPEYKLKLIFIFDKESLEYIIENCFDFYSTNSFSYQFTDHSYTFERSEIVTNSKLSDAIERYEKSPNLKPKLEIELLFNIGKEAYAISNLELSMEYYQKSEKLARENNLNFEISAILGNIGLIYQDKGDLDQALKYQKESLQIQKEIGHTQGIASSLGNIGLIYSEKEDKALAKKYYNEALAIFEEIGYFDGIETIKENLARIGK